MLCAAMRFVRVAKEESGDAYAVTRGTSHVGWAVAIPDR